MVVVPVEASTAFPKLRTMRFLRTAPPASLSATLAAPPSSTGRTTPVPDSPSTVIPADTLAVPAAVAHVWVGMLVAL